jgi:hypothetical protein
MVAGEVAAAVERMATKTVHTAAGVAVDVSTKETVPITVRCDDGGAFDIHHRRASRMKLLIPIQKVNPTNHNAAAAVKEVFL